MRVLLLKNMADRRATNKYYPPDWDPSKGSINTYRGQHVLRDRARKLDQGILIIRFEMPFNIWCGSCNKSIGQGVRFNAEKKTVGKYYSTSIYEFRMKCHLCSGVIVVRTDPENRTYRVTEGGRRKEETYSATDAGVFELKTDEERAELNDPFARLEQEKIDQDRANEENPRIRQIISIRDDWSDDYAVSQVLRAEHRERKKKHIKQLQDGASRGLPLPLLDSDESDSRAAAQQSFRNRTARSSREASLNRLKHSSIFASSTPTTTQRAAMKKSRLDRRALSSVLSSSIGSRASSALEAQSIDLFTPNISTSQSKLPPARGTAKKRKAEDSLFLPVVRTSR